MRHHILGAKLRQRGKIYSRLGELAGRKLLGTQSAQQHRMLVAQLQRLLQRVDSAGHVVLFVALLGFIQPFFQRALGGIVCIVHC